MAVPMIVGDAVLGVLDVQSEWINYFTQEDVFTKTILANQIAGAVQNARLFEGVLQAQQEMAVVNKVLQEVGRQQDLEQLLQAVYGQIQHIVPTDIFFVGLYDPATQLITYPLVYDNNQQYEQTPVPAPPGSNVERVLATGEAVLINHTLEEMDAAPLSPENAIGDRGKTSVSLLYLPLRFGERVLGVMSVQSYQVNAYNSQDVTLLNSIASQVSVAVENIRLYKQAENRARREQVLREVTARVRSSADVETVLRTAAQEVGRALNRPAFVYLDNNQQQPTPETKE
jgi:GAF domain-containing protein